MSSTNGLHKNPLDDSRTTLSSVLVDDAVTALLMPWACPCPFGPNGRYRLEELVGAGRSSLVYRATDTHMSSEGFPAAVAIKISRRGGSSCAEALTGRRINHPNVLRVLDRGEDGSGCGYVVAEFVQGGDLEAKPGPWEPRAAVAFMAKLARAVHAAHSAGVVHCDLKPANILLTTEGEPKLADFDLARSAVDDSKAARGNVAFMSPEQFAGEPDSLSPPSDVYALGGLLFHLLTGKFPNGNTAEEVASAHQLNSRPLLRWGWSPIWIASVLGLWLASGRIVTSPPPNWPVISSVGSGLSLCHGAAQRPPGGSRSGAGGVPIAWSACSQQPFCWALGCS